MKETVKINLDKVLKLGRSKNAVMAIGELAKADRLVSIWGVANALGVSVTILRERLSVAGLLVGSDGKYALLEDEVDGVEIPLSLFSKELTPRELVFWATVREANDAGAEWVEMSNSEVAIAVASKRKGKPHGTNTVPLCRKLKRLGLMDYIPGVAACGDRRVTVRKYRAITPEEAFEALT